MESSTTEEEEESPSSSFTTSEGQEDSDDPEPYTRGPRLSYSDINNSDDESELSCDSIIAETRHATKTHRRNFLVRHVPFVGKKKDDNAHSAHDSIKIIPIDRRGEEGEEPKGTEANRLTPEELKRQKKRKKKLKKTFEKSSSDVNTEGGDEESESPKDSSIYQTMTKLKDTQLAEMKRMLQVNCLRKGKHTSSGEKRWMVAVDGSISSLRAFNAVVSLMNKEKDHLYVVTVRDKNLPPKMTEKEIMRLRYELWWSAMSVQRPYLAVLDEENIEYTAIIPDAWDVRKLLCMIVKKFNIDVLAIGKHKRNEKSSYQHHFRSCVHYCKHHARCEVQVY